jgi:hypothetical protein
MTALDLSVLALGAVGEAAAESITLLLLAVWFVFVGLFVLGDPSRGRAAREPGISRRDDQPAATADHERKAA